MTANAPVPPAAPPKSLLRSAVAVVAGFAAVALLAGIVDEILHLIGVFPPWGQVTYAPVPYVLATGYRVLFGVAGGYLTARLAPRGPVGHALVLGVVGTVLSAASVPLTIARHLGPVWYPVALALTSMPAAWAGGMWYAKGEVTR